MSATSVLKSAPDGKSWRKDACAEPGFPSSSSGQVSSTIVGRIAIRASFGHSIGRRGFLISSSVRCARFCHANRVPLISLVGEGSGEGPRPEAVVGEDDALVRG